MNRKQERYERAVERNVNEYVRHERGIIGRVPHNPVAQFEHIMARLYDLNDADFDKLKGSLGILRSDSRFDGQLRNLVAGRGVAYSRIHGHRAWIDYRKRIHTAYNAGNQDDPELQAVMLNYHIHKELD